MSGYYRSDRDWADKHIPQVKQIVGPLLLCQSSVEEDTKQAADLKLLIAGRMHIAVRLRRYGYADVYPFDFTIRSDRDSGAKTELEKIENGFADWLFYGHADKDDQTICRWMIIDLANFRFHWGEKFSPERRALKISSGRNPDGTSFVAVDVRSFPPHPPILVASSFELTA